MNKNKEENEFADENSIFDKNGHLKPFKCYLELKKIPKYRKIIDEAEQRVLRYIRYGK